MNINEMKFKLGDEVYHKVYKVNGVVMERKIAHLPSGIFQEYTIGCKNENGQGVQMDVTDAWLEKGHRLDID